MQTILEQKVYFMKSFFLNNLFSLKKKTNYSPNFAIKDITI